MEEKQIIFCNVESCKYCTKTNGEFYNTCKRSCIQVTTIGCLAYEEKKEKEIDGGYQE